MQASTPPSPDPHRKPPDVLYIMGTGRSGSTILEIVLADAVGAHGAGELFDVIEDGLQRNVLCSCGQPFDRCPIWQPVSRALAPLAPDPVAATAQFRRIEWHRGCLQRWLSPRPLPAQYESYQRTLLDALRAATGAATLIDSSKYAGRALALNQLLGEDLKVVWLLRSPSGILQSFRKPNQDEQRPKALLSAFTYVLFVSLCCRLAQARLGSQCLVIHYEDFMAAPERELQRLGDWSGIDFSHVKQRIGSGENFDVGHLLTANRLRKQGRVHLRPETPLRQQLPGAHQVAAMVLNVWYALLGVRRR